MTGTAKRVLDEQQKNEIKRELARRLRDEPEVRRLVVFGSFLHSDNPHDVDLAVFQDSNEAYLPLALKYRRRIRDVLHRIAVNVIPIRPDPPDVEFLDDIEKGEVKYPVASAIPDATPDPEVCERCLELAERVVGEVAGLLEE